MSTIVIPALVAAVVTLGIEYFAKPSLEARKDRVLEADRARRAARRHWVALDFHLRRLVGMAQGDQEYRRDDRDAELHAQITEQFKGLKAAIAAGGDDIERIAGGGLLTLMNVWDAYLLIRSQGFAREVIDPIAVLSLQSISEAANCVYLTPKWRWCRRKKALAKLRAIGH